MNRRRGGFHETSDSYVRKALLQTHRSASNPIEAPSSPVEALLKIPKTWRSNQRKPFLAMEATGEWLPPAGLAFLLVQDTRCCLRGNSAHNKTAVSGEKGLFLSPIDGLPR